MKKVWRAGYGTSVEESYGDAPSQQQLIAICQSASTWPRPSIRQFLLAIEMSRHLGERIEAYLFEREGVTVVGNL